jgi:UDP-N-acetylglucosamine diphosphorylase/glucosamine-1-phosphate N-acetyltransferase
MYLCLFEDEVVANLRPLTDTRPVYDLRIGGRTIAQQTARVLGADHLLLHARPSLAEIAARNADALVNRIPGSLGVLFVNGRAVFRPGSEAVKGILDAVGSDETAGFESDGQLVAAWVPDASRIELGVDALDLDSFGAPQLRQLDGVRIISRLWHLLGGISECIADEFDDFARGYNIFERPGASIHDSVVLVNGEAVIVAKGAEVRAGAIINASDGPVIIDEGATIFERAVITGPAYVGRGSYVKIGANLEHVTIGPRCKVAGEIHDTIVHSYSNKAHDGYLGSSCIGSWCNLGAATNNSNMKNDYGSVRLFNMHAGTEEDTGSQFIGLFMGDHSKSGIGTTFNTGTVVGVNCNLYGAGFHARYVPSFCWGSPDEYSVYRIDKALEVAERVMRRRDVAMVGADREVLRDVYERSEKDRAKFLQ